MNDNAVTDMAINKTILWQDHTHGQGYNPTLRLIEYPDNKFALELNVFGRVTVVPYIKAECQHRTKLSDI
jgi:hypothetical protein